MLFFLPSAFLGFPLFLVCTLTYNFPLHARDLEIDLHSRICTGYFLQCSACSSQEAQIIAYIRRNTSFIHTHNPTSLQIVWLRRSIDCEVSVIVFSLLFSAPTCVSGFNDCKSPIVLIHCKWINQIVQMPLWRLLHFENAYIFSLL